MLKKRGQGHVGFQLFSALILAGFLLLTGQNSGADTQYTLDCASCHSMPPLDSPDGARNPESGAFKGNHQSHMGVTATAGTCSKCHGAGTADYLTGHRTTEIKVTTNINNSPHPSGALYQREGAVFLNQTTIPPLGNCSNVNCHFETATSKWGSASTTNCSTCHGEQPSTYSHSIHLSLATVQNSCAPCHTPHSTFTHATSAGKRSINLNNVGYSGENGKYLPSQSADRTVGTCATASCHASPYGQSYLTSPLWGATVGCAACHKDGGAFDGTSGAPVTGSHAKHMALTDSACNLCHNGAVKNSSGGDNHLNDTIDVSNGYPVTAKHTAGSYSGTCTTASCHSNPYGTGSTTTPVWGQTVGCAACHNGAGAFDTTSGAPTTGSHGAHMALYNSSCGQCHDGSVKGSSGGANHANGTVEVTNDYVGAPVAKHAPGSYTGYCASASCHASPYGAGAVISPVWGSTTGCASCHTDSGAFTANGAPDTGSHTKHMAITNAACNLCHSGAISGVSGGTNHSNDNVDVLNGYPVTVARHPAGTYSGTCTTASCHSDGNGVLKTTPKWGKSLATDCSGCHGGASGSVQTMATGKHASHMNNYSTMGRGNDLVCSECHSATVSGNTSLIAGGKHLNSFKDYTGAKAGQLNTTCENVYCHSSGQAVPVFRSMTGSKIWSGNAKLTCSGCHGSSAGATWSTTFGVPNYPNGATTPNSHQKHIEANNVTDSRGCARCHTTTVDALVVGKLRDYSTAHLNKSRDVAYRFAFTGYSENYKADTKNCTTYCHSNVQTPGGNGPATLYNAPNWGNNGTMTCASCHKDMSTLAETTDDLQLGSHRRHAVLNNVTSGSSGAGYACSTCHGASYSATAFNPASHTDGTINLSFTDKGANTTYSQASDNSPANGYGSCSTSKCHGRATRNWGLNSDARTCEKCHGSTRTAAQTGAFTDTAGNATSKYAGSHASHLAGSHNISDPIACSQCHTVPASISSFGHMSSLPARLAWGTLASHNASYPGDVGHVGTAVNPAYSGAPGRTCTNNYCHAGVLKKADDGVTMVPSGADPAPTWGVSGYLACNKCHGYPPPAPHNTSTTCSACHNHVDQSNVGFTSSGKSLHINGTIEVTVDECLGCHSSTACPEGATNCIERRLVGSHNVHTDADLFLTGKSLSKGDFLDPSWIYEIKYVGGFPRYACGFCHNMLDSGLHKNMNIDVDLDPSHSLTGTVKTKNKTRDSVAGDKTWFGTPFVSGQTVTCQNVYCHSNGYISEDTKTYDYHATPNWYYKDQNGVSPWANVDKCSQCHGNSPNSNGMAGSSAHGKHNVAIHSKGVFSGITSLMTVAGGVGSGSVHGDPNTSTTISCNMCHYDTVKASWNDKNPNCSTCHSAAGSGGLKGTLDIYTSNKVHVDGKVDVVFKDPYVMKSKAQLRNNITTVQTVYTSWTRVKGYKTYSSYDLARKKPAYSQGTCSTTSCHNSTTMEWRTQGPLNCAACHNGLPR